MKSTSESLHQRSRAGRGGSSSFHLPPLAAGPASSRCCPAEQRPGPAPAPSGVTWWHLVQRPCWGAQGGGAGALTPNPASLASAARAGRSQQNPRGRGFMEGAKGSSWFTARCSGTAKQINCGRAWLPPRCAQPLHMSAGGFVLVPSVGALESEQDAGPTCGWAPRRILRPQRGPWPAQPSPCGSHMFPALRAEQMAALAPI